jgi:hypothetical protein
MNTLATTALLVRLDELQAELNALEAQMASNTLPHSDQALLDDAWDAIVAEMEQIQDIIAIDEANHMEDLRDAQDLYDFAEAAACYDPSDEI